MRTIDVGALEEQLRTAGPSALLPERLVGSLPVSGPLVVEDLLALHGALLVIVRCGDATIATPLVGAPAASRRARPGDGAFAGLVRAREDEIGGRFRWRRSEGMPVGSSERAVAVDQSNESVVVDEAAIVKLHPVVVAGARAALDVPRHLAEVGFGETPALLGALTWSDAAGDEGLVATLTELLPGARDGWDWHVELLEEVADGGRPPAAWARSAADLGGLVARLHVALATASSVFPTPRSLATTEGVASWMRRALATLDEALELTDGAEGERLRSREPGIRRALAAERSVATTPVSGIHGDLHVGQLLPWRDGFAVIDFEGNPLQRGDRRGAIGPPARDVASAVRSLDHVGRILQRRRPDRASDVGAWIAEARASFLEAYTAQLAGLGAGDLFDDRLLHPFEVAQECHEYVYAARYLRTWRYVPDLALPSLLEGG